MSATRYHIEVRQFPHNSCHFNMTESQLRAIAQPWSQMEWVEIGERKWNPHQAKLTILHGPEIPLQQLSLGRGWPTAKREGEDVTERVLAACRSSASVAPAPPAAAAPAPERAHDDGSSSPPVELAPLLGDEAQALLEAWRHAAALYPERAPSETLAVAEDAIRSSARRQGEVQ